jgi:hypothetical protein
MEMFKDVTIGEHKYRIGRLPASAGTWIVSLVVKEIQGTLSEAEHAKIQRHLLSVCSRFKGDHPMPILKADGSYAVKDDHLEFDLDLVMKLKKEARDFNFADFFAARAREAIASMALDQTTENTTA